MQISEYCSVYGLTLRMGERLEKTFSSEEELDKAIITFERLPKNFAENKGSCSSIIEEARFPFNSFLFSNRKRL